MDNSKVLAQFLGMPAEKFIAFGVGQKTLAQFIEAWNRIGEYPLD